MSLRIDTSEWIAGSLVIGDTGLGVLGSAIPTTGDNGAGYAYNDLTLPEDAGKEICGRITSWPSAGTLFAYEDTSFEFSGAPDGTYSFEYQLYVDGVAIGTPQTVTLQVGAVAHSATGSLSASAAAVAGTSARMRLHSASGDLSAAVASISAVANRSVVGAIHTATGELLAGAAVVVGGAFNNVTFTQAQLDYMLAYMEANLMIPTAEQIAAAVLSALNATAIPVDVTKINHVTLTGAGTPANPMRPM